MTHGSLFSGIGGFDLPSEWMGWENVFHCEWMPFPRQVLKYHFPNSICYEDITKTDFTIHRGGIDILTGGFPCQPYSLAGKRKGTEDSRHLWPEMLRAIREIQPKWILGENVFGIVSWSGGLVFEQVQSEMEAEGYEVQPFVIPACAKDAPHRRDRSWFVAHASNKRCNDRSNNRQERCIQGNERTSSENKPKWNGRKRRAWSFGSDATNTEGSSFERELQQRQEQGEFRRCNCKTTTNDNSRRQPSEEHRETQPEWASKNGIPGDWQNFPTESPICSGNDGISDRLDGITFPKWRNESIKAYGNAVVPQIVFEIFKAIQKYEDLH